MPTDRGDGDWLPNPPNIEARGPVKTAPPLDDDDDDDDDDDVKMNDEDANDDDDNADADERGDDDGTAPHMAQSSCSVPLSNVHTAHVHTPLTPSPSPVATASFINE